MNIEVKMNDESTSEVFVTCEEEIKLGSKIYAKFEYLTACIYSERCKFAISHKLGL